MKNIFINASLDDLKRGFQEDEHQLTCLICGKSFVKGEIYACQDHFYDAYKMMEAHICTAHHSVLDYLLSLNSDYLGISDSQKAILQAMAEGKSDKEIAAAKQLSASTVRNHRFKLREKQRQAKLYLTVMSLLDADTSEMIDAHPTATMIDERYHLTETERQSILSTYMTEAGALKEIPSKEKRKIVVLKEIAKNFKAEKQYSEVEINRILKRVNEDYPYLRRLLVEYGFLERTRDGSCYWLR